MKSINTIKKTIVLVFAGILLYSCSSDEAKTPVDAQIKHKVHINASGFSTTVGAIKKSETRKLEDHISKLHYFALKLANNGITYEIVQHKEQLYDNDPVSFGSVDLELENGAYTIFVIGEQKNETGGYSKVDYHGTRPYLLYGYATPVGDLFMSKQDIIIHHESTTTNFTLNRIVGQLEVKITDPIPEGTDSIEVVIANEIGNYYFDIDDQGGLQRARLYTTKISNEDIGSTTFSRKMFVLRTGGPVVNVQIRLLDKKGEIIASKTKDNVELQRNKKTILNVSNLLSPTTPVSGNVTVQINSDWEYESAQEF